MQILHKLPHLVAHVDEPVRCAQSSSHYVPQFSSAYSFDSSFVLISVYMNARAWDNRFGLFICWNHFSTVKEAAVMLDGPLTIEQIRLFMDKQRGRTVKPTVNHSKKKKTINKGTIAEIYPRHFIIALIKAPQ